MSRRDELAEKILIACIGAPWVMEGVTETALDEDVSEFDLLSQMAYAQADALIREGEKCTPSYSRES